MTGIAILLAMCGTVSFRICSVLLLISIAESQVPPSRFIFPDSETMNGSSATGGCSNVTTGLGDGFLSQCNDPTTSVLFDGNIPTLTGLDGDMWAGQLLTLPKSVSRVEIRIEYSSVPVSTSLQGGEVVMFNCPEWGISAHTIKVLTGTELFGMTSHPEIITLNTSCDSLVRVCIPQSTAHANPVVELEFFPPIDSDWVHLAEVAFYGDKRPCTSGPITTPTTPVTTDTASTTESNSSTTEGHSSSIAEGHPSATTEGHTSSSLDFPTTTSADFTTIPDPARVIAAVIVTVVIVIIAILVVIVIIVCLKRKQAKQGKATLASPRNINGNDLGVGTLQKEADIEMTGQGTYEAVEELDKDTGSGRSKKDGFDSGKAYTPGGRGGMYRDMDPEPTSGNKGFIPGTGARDTCEDADKARYEKTGEPADQDVYNVLREDRQIKDSTYSRLDEFPDQPQVAGEATYSTVSKPSKDQRETSLSDVYSQVDKTKKEVKPLTEPRAQDELYAQVDKAKKKAKPLKEPIQDQLYAQVDKSKKKSEPPPDAEYAVVSRSPAPTLPSKSPSLSHYLETKPLPVEPSCTGDRTSPPRITMLTRSVVSTGAMSTNPIYASTNHTVTTDNEVQDNA